MFNVSLKKRLLAAAGISIALIALVGLVIG